MKNKRAELEQIEADINQENICPDLAKIATNLVMGEGNENAEIVFIGEAPGKKEDEQGRPFVGAAGKFLDEMLSEVELDRKDVFITNIVKYRPPNNRDPLPAEKKAFWPFLIRQLDVISPKIVVTLGRHSMENFLPGMRISQIHGQPKRIRVLWPSKASTEAHSSAVQGSSEQRSETYKDVRAASSAAADAAMCREQSAGGELGSAAGDCGELVVVPLYHPAAALYNGGMRETLLDDFARVPKILTKIKQEN